MKIGNINTLIISMMMLLALPALASAATVSVGESTTVGSTVSIPINISGAPDVGAMVITFTYNSSILSATNVSKGSVTSEALLVVDGTIEDGTISDADNDTIWNYGALIGDIADGRVNISMINTNGFSGDGTIAFIYFDIVGIGTTLLNLSAVSANETATCDPCTSETVFDPASYPSIPITTKNGSYTVEGVEYDSADTNRDCVVGPMELMTQIGKWKGGEVGPMELMTSIAKWKLGTNGYC